MPPAKRIRDGAAWKSEIQMDNNNSGKTLLWILAVIGAIAAIAGIAYAVYKYMTPSYIADSEDDFFDDFEDDYTDISEAANDGEAAS